MPRYRDGRIQILPEDQRALEKAINKLKIDFPQSAVNEFHEWGDDTATVIRESAPEDTGFLKENIDSVKVTRGRGGVAIRSKATYSGFVEYGTRHNLPQPYFYQNISRRASDLVDRLLGLIFRIAKAKGK